MQQLSATIASLSQRLADVRVTEITCASNIEELTERIASLRQTLKEKNEQLFDLSSMKLDFEKQLKEIEEKLIMLQNSIEGLQLKSSARIQKRDEVKELCDRLKLECEEKAGRARILTDLSRNFEGFYNSVKVVMKEAKKGSLGGIHGPVTTLIKVPSEYNIAMEVALGARMQHIVVDTDADAKRAIELLKKRDAGRATFLPISTIKPRRLDEKGLDDCYGYIGIASELCTCDKRYEAILTNLLGKIVVAEDLSGASAIAKKYSYRFMIVTLDGQVINAGGSFTGGSRAKNSGLLSRESEIESLNRQADALREKLSAATEDLKRLQAQCSACDADLLGARADLSNAQQDSVRIRAEYNACVNEYQSVEAQINAVHEEISVSEKKIEESNKTRLAAQKEMVKFTAEMETAEIKIKKLSGERDEMVHRREELSEQLQELRLSIVTLEKDVETVTSEIESAKLSGNDQQRRISELETERAQLEQQNLEIESRIAALEAEIASLLEKIKSFNEDIENLNTELNKQDKRSIELRQLEREKASERELSSNEIARLEEKKLSLQKQYDDIIAKLWEEYELTLNEAQTQAAQIENLTEARTRLSSLKQKIKALGTVNVGAIEEYKEVSERYQFMSAQVEDVEKSKNELMRLITDLTKQMKDVFVDSFSEINRNFGVTFKELFLGGEARLELSDPENVLTSGIDIIVHPPGKIVVHLEALSGGEKALVAIALYFAIMKVRPAPFCVMDEIEAALDEVNVDRFAQYLRTLTGRTQFILITHRRGTMEEADVLYGVTMQDEGISKLLELRASEVATKLGLTE